MPGMAIANAALREFVLLPVVGVAAQPLSGVTLATLLAVYAFIVLRHWIGPGSFFARWLLGVIWAALSLLFEYILIALSHDRPFQTLLESLSLSAMADGNLFVLTVLLLLVAPAVLSTRRR